MTLLYRAPTASSRLKSSDFLLSTGPISVVAADAFLGSVNAPIEVTTIDGLGLQEVNATALIYPVSLTETAGFNPFTNMVTGLVDADLTDGVAFDPTAATRQTDAMSDAFSVSAISAASLPIRMFLSDLTRLGDAILQHLTYGPHLADRLRLPDILIDIRRYGPLLTEALGLAESAADVKRPGGLAFDGLRLMDPMVGNAKTGIASADRTTFTDFARTGWPVGLTDTFTTADVLTLVRAVTVLDRLQLRDVLLGGRKMGLSILERLRLLDALSRFFGGGVVDGLNVVDPALALARHNRSVTEMAGFADQLAKHFVVRVTTKDDLALQPVEALKLLFRPTLVEGVEIVAGFVAPNGGITTWAVNTRTGATTEYTNFAFNSFAQISHKYLGASSSGLYELNGGTDAGTDIVAQIKSGFAQFAGSHFTSFKAAYLGLRGGGDYVLKLETGDGKTYTYNVLANDMATTKINVGKGLRARYFSFELLSTGQDFDLDSIEFLPLMANRRV